MIPLIFSFLLIAVAIFTVTNLYRYSSLQPTWHALLTTCLGWFTSFCVVVLMPVDVAAAVTGDPLPLPIGGYLGLWEAFYWISFLLTWLIIPLQQSYVMSGEFTFLRKLKASLRENFIFYSVNGVLLVAFIIYIAAVYGLKGRSLFSFAIALSNLWGLILVVVCLGHGLIDVPRQLWRSSWVKLYLLRLEFRATIANDYKDESKLELADTVAAVKKADEAVAFHDELREKMNKIVALIPSDFDGHGGQAESVEISEKSLVKLHKRLINALWESNVAEQQLDHLIDEAYDMQAVVEAELSPEHVITRENGNSGNFEWWWRLRIKPILLRSGACILGILSGAILWSEITMAIQIDMSIWSLIIHARGVSSGVIEAIVMIGIIHIAICTFSSLFKLRIFNYYRLQNRHHSDSNSLLFSAAYSCRLAPSICYNMLYVTHEANNAKKPTVFLSFFDIGDDLLGDSLGLYFPLVLILLCFLTFFTMYDRILGLCGVQKFRYEDDFHAERVELGREMLEREKARRARVRAREREREVATRPITSSRPSIRRGFDFGIRFPNFRSQGENLPLRAK